MKVLWFLLYLIFAYAAYYNSQRYKANGYLWTALGIAVPYVGFLISLLYFRKKTVAINKPGIAPLGFRSRSKWKMAVASVIYFMFLFVVGVGVFGGSTDSIPQSNAVTTIKSDTKNGQENAAENINDDLGQNTQKEASDTPITSTVNGELKIHYIDVGQADSILIQQAGKNMLIDAGNNADANTIIRYLQNNGVSKLDVIVATHPHEDHIGAMDEVIKTFDVGTIYVSNGTTTTQTYMNFINAVKSKGLKLTRAIPGTEFNLGDTKNVVVAPNNDQYEDLNNYSVVIKLTYGINKFIFQGDAEAISENEILNSSFDISADVVKIGHHGSDSSSVQRYLDKIHPKYAVISVGKENDYGHPDSDVISRLNRMGVKTYRTDENGTIVAVSNGENITFDNIPSAASSNNENRNDDNNGDSGAKAPIAVPDTDIERETPKPTPTPAPAQSNVKVSASVDDVNPAQNSTINLIVAGPAGGKVSAVCHYKSTDTLYSGTIGSNGKAVISIRIGRASKGYKVDIEVTVSYTGKTYSAEASFTPQ